MVTVGEEWSLASESLDIVFLGKVKLHIWLRPFGHILLVENHLSDRAVITHNLGGELRKHIRAAAVEGAGVVQNKQAMPQVVERSTQKIHAHTLLKFFKIYFIDYAITVVPFSPFTPTPSHPHSPPL